LLVVFRPSHNFLTQSLRKSIKSRKDLDAGLVSNKTLSGMFPSSSFSQGPGNLS